MNENQNNLINNLCDDLKPQKSYCSFTFWMGGIVAAILYITAVIAILGLRYDFIDQLGNAAFITELLAVITLFLLASYSASLLNCPDGKQRPVIKFITVFIAVAFISYILLKAILGANSLFHWPDLWSHHCSHNSLIIDLIPFVALIILTARGCTTRPYWSIAMNILAVSALGWGTMRITCPMDTIGHSMITHFLPFAIIGIIIGFFAKKLFRW